MPGAVSDLGPPPRCLAGAGMPSPGCIGSGFAPTVLGVPRCSELFCGTPGTAQSCQLKAENLG